MARSRQIAIPEATLARARAMVESGTHSVERAARELGLVPRSLRSVAKRNAWYRPVANWYQVAQVGLAPQRGGSRATPAVVGVVLKYLAEGYPLRIATGMAGITRSVWEKWRGTEAQGYANAALPGLSELEALALAHAGKRDVDAIRVSPTGLERVAQLRDPDTFGALGQGQTPAAGPLAVQINVGGLRPQPVHEGALREQLSGPNAITIEAEAEQVHGEAEAAE